jgi:hypothetical protein
VNSLDAECRKREIPTEMFFLFEESNPNTREGQVPEECRAACLACKIRLECLDWALLHEDHGYYATTRRNARKKLRKQLGIRISAPTSAPPWQSVD